MSVTFFHASSGEHDQKVAEGNEQVIDVAAVCYHESFALRHLRHDIAVLTLSKPAVLSDKVGTVCLPQSGQQVAPGTKCYITGMAITAMHTHYCPTIKVLSLKIVVAA